MSFFSKLFSRKKEEQKPQPRYVILNDRHKNDESMPLSRGDGSYRILDTKENMKLGLHICHYNYDASQIPHEEYPDANKNGSRLQIDVVLGDFSYFPGDDNINFCYYDEVLDKDIKRRANKDDVDFAFYTRLQKEIETSEHPEQALLLHTLLKVINSEILTSPSRVTEEYRQQQKIKKEAERAKKEKALKIEREKYQQEQLRIAEERKLESQQKKAKISQYLYNMRNSILEK